MKKKNTAKNLIWCDNGCKTDIGFTTQAGAKYFDNEVFNIGHKFYCPSCALELGIYF